jgi:hypothetical protein
MEVTAVPKCTSWRGHKFEARYSSRPGRMPSPEQLFWVGYSLQLDVVNASRIQTYECDVCVRCGHVVQQPQKAQQ